MIGTPPAASADGRPAGVAARLDALAARLGALAGWRRAGLGVALGVAATGALPPLHIVPLVFVAFGGLLWLAEGARARRTAFLDGWCFGFGHFATGLYWLAHALLVDAQAYGWMIPFAVFGLAAVLGLYTGAATLALHASGARGAPAALVLAIAWTAAEWLRGHLLTGFPWNLTGTVWAATPSMMQPAALVGLYGLGLLTVLVGALVAVRRPTPAAAALALLIAGWAWGSARLPDQAASVPQVKLRLVQPNIPQTLKWDPVQREANLRRTLALTASEGIAGRTHVIWPETAMPFAITDVNPNGPALRAALASVTPPGGVLLTGAVRVVRDDPLVPQLWNSLQAVDASGAIVATYDKHHLVPFGEFVPLRPLVALIGVTPAGALDFSAGPGPATIDLPGLPPASPLICYEAIFPAAVTGERRPAWLLNITNDAWFGISSGPHQHFAAARFRAVEEGLPLVRAANNGISAVVDAYGRTIAQLGLGATGVLDADLPVAGSATVYARLGDASLLMLMFAAAGLAAIGCRRAR